VLRSRFGNVDCGFDGYELKTKLDRRYLVVDDTYLITIAKIVFKFNTISPTPPISSSSSPWFATPTSTTATLSKYTPSAVAGISIGATIGGCICTVVALLLLRKGNRTRRDAPATLLPQPHEWTSPELLDNNAVVNEATKESYGPRERGGAELIGGSGRR